MELFSYKSSYDFMGPRKITMGIAVALIILSLTLVFTKGINWALDFTGGIVTEVHLAEDANDAKIRAAVEEAGLEGARVQSFGARDFAIRLPPAASTESPAPGAAPVIKVNPVEKALIDAGMKPTIKRSDDVGAQVGDELFVDGLYALLLVMGGILLYVAVRFEWRFGVAAVAGQLHDVIVTVGFVVLMGFDFDLTTLAALLTILGYSINDKIVVFDRIREYFRSARKDSPVEILNASINTTLARTIMTSVTVLINVVIMALLGGDALRDFAWTLTFGVIIGTLSSIFVASPILLLLGVSKRDLMSIQSDDPRLAARP